MNDGVKGLKVEGAQEDGCRATTRALLCSRVAKQEVWCKREATSGCILGGSRGCCGTCMLDASAGSVAGQCEAVLGVGTKDDLVVLDDRLVLLGRRWLILVHMQSALARY